jgi:hypothetical protein
MAVKQIRKISSTVLIVLAVISVIVFCLTLFGGYVDPNAEMPVPKYADVLLYTAYAMTAIAVLAMIVFGIIGFVQSFKTNSKAALGALGAFVGLVLLLVITYAVGGTDPLAVGIDSQQYNTPKWLKVADMFMYSAYVLVIVNILAIIVTSFMHAGPKKHASSSEKR